MKLTLAFFLMVILFACKNETKPNKGLLTFDLTNLAKTSGFKLSDLNVDDICYIPLATDSSSRLSEIIQMKAFNDYFLIQDMGKNSKIRKFYCNGDFAGAIGRQDCSPIGPRFAYDYSVAPEDGKLYVRRKGDNKICVYKPDGTFLHAFTSPSPNTSILYCLPDCIFCYNKNTGAPVENSIDIIGYDGNKIKSYKNKFPCNFDVAHACFNDCIIYRFKNQLCFKELHSDTVFFYDEGRFSPKFILKQGTKKFTAEARSGLKLSNFLPTIARHIVQRHILETYNYFFFHFGLNNRYYWFIYSKDEKKQYCIDSGKGFKNDFDGGPVLMPRAIKDDNIIINWVKALELKAHVASDAFINSTPQYPEKKKQLAQLANSLNEGDNPVLMLVKLKQ